MNQAFDIESIQSISLESADIRLREDPEILITEGLDIFLVENVGRGPNSDSKTQNGLILHPEKMSGIARHTNGKIYGIHYPEWSSYNQIISILTSQEQYKNDVFRMRVDGVTGLYGSSKTGQMQVSDSIFISNRVEKRFRLKHDEFGAYCGIEESTESITKRGNRCLIEQGNRHIAEFKLKDKDNSSYTYPIRFILYSKGDDKEAINEMVMLGYVKICRIELGFYDKLRQCYYPVFYLKRVLLDDVSEANQLNLIDKSDDSSSIKSLNHQKPNENKIIEQEISEITDGMLQLDFTL